MRPPEAQHALPQRDQAALSWYFSSGAAAFEKSTMGPMLDRAELYSLKRLTLTCRACRGEGVHGDGSWCGRCHGTGASQSRVDFKPDSPDEMPVNETQSASGGYTPDDSTLMRFAVISRRLKGLPVAWQDALEAYHGPKGDRCEHAPGWRMIALYPIVPAGKRLAQLADDHLDDLARERYRGEPAYEKCWWQVCWQQTSKRVPRAALIEAAETQSVELYGAATGGWIARAA